MSDSNALFEFIFNGRKIVEIKDQNEGLKLALENHKSNVVYMISLYGFEDSLNLGVFTDISYCFKLANDILESHIRYSKKCRKILSDGIKKYPDFEKDNYSLIHLKRKIKHFEFEYYTSYYEDEKHSLRGHRFSTKSNPNNCTEGFTVSIKPIVIDELSDRLPENEIIPQDNKESIKEFRRYLKSHIRDYPKRQARRLERQKEREAKNNA